MPCSPSPGGPRSLYLLVRGWLLLLGPLVLLHSHGRTRAGARHPQRPGRIFPPRLPTTGRARGQTTKFPAAARPPWRQLWEGHLPAICFCPAQTKLPRHRPQTRLSACAVMSVVGDNGLQIFIVNSMRL